MSLQAAKLLEKMNSSPPNKLSSLSVLFFCGNHKFAAPRLKTETRRISSKSSSRRATRGVLKTEKYTASLHSKGRNVSSFSVCLRIILSTFRWIKGDQFTWINFRMFMLFCIRMNENMARLTKKGKYAKKSWS